MVDSPRDAPQLQVFCSGTGFDIYNTWCYTLVVRILKTKRFAKLATDEGLTDEALKDAIKEFEEGLTGDALGGNLYKKRVAVGSKGKSGGLRTILVYKAAADDKIFCVEVFPKNKKENISKTELAGLKRYADYLLGLKAKEIKKAIDAKALIEVKRDGDNKKGSKKDSNKESGDGGS